jgi:excisionase family DNA binding protein
MKARNEQPVPKLMTVAEVADLLGISPKTIYAWASQGRLPCVRLGSLLRFDPSEIARWVGDRKEG